MMAASGIHVLLPVSDDSSSSVDLLGLLICDVLLSTVLCWMTQVSCEQELDLVVSRLGLLVTGHEDQGIPCPSTRGACYRTGLRPVVLKTYNNGYTYRDGRYSHICVTNGTRWVRRTTVEPSRPDFSILSTHCFCFTRGRGGCETKQPGTWFLSYRTYVRSQHQRDETKTRRSKQFHGPICRAGASGYGQGGTWACQLLGPRLASCRRQPLMAAPRRNRLTRGVEKMYRHEQPFKIVVHVFYYGYGYGMLIVDGIYPVDIPRHG